MRATLDGVFRFAVSGLESIRLSLVDEAKVRETCRALAVSPVEMPSANEIAKARFEAQIEADASPWRPAREKPVRGSRVIGKSFSGAFVFGTFDTGGAGVGIFSTAAWTTWSNIEAWMLVPELPRWARR